MSTDTSHLWLSQQDQDKVEASLDKARRYGWKQAGRNFLAMADGDERYALWMILADRHIGRATGLGMFDLEDWGWADAYDDGSSPKEAAMDCLSSDSLYSSMFGGDE